MPEEHHEWRPDWCIAPSATLEEWMTEHHTDVPVLAETAAGQQKARDAARQIRAVLDRHPLTEAHARVLEAGTAIPARMWLALEHDYRAGLAAGLADTT